MMSVAQQDARRNAARTAARSAEELRSSISRAARRRRRVIARNSIVFMSSLFVVAAAVGYLTAASSGPAFAAQLHVHETKSQPAPTGTVVVYGSVVDVNGQGVAAEVEITTRNHGEPIRTDGVTAADGTYRLVVPAGNEEIVISTLAKGHKAKGHTRFDATTGLSYNVSAQIVHRPKVFFFFPFSSY